MGKVALGEMGLQAHWATVREVGWHLTCSFRPRAANSLAGFSVDVGDEVERAIKFVAGVLSTVESPTLFWGHLMGTSEGV